MKLTNKRLKRLIQEAVTSQIKKITPLDRRQRGLHHAFQQPVIPPEVATPKLEPGHPDYNPDDSELKKKLSGLRAVGDKESNIDADSLAGMLYGDSKPSFGLTRQGHPSIPYVQEPPLDLDTYDYQEINKQLDAGYIDEYATEESAFLEINYPFSDVIERYPELENSQLNRIIDELYDTNNVKDFYVSIRDYIADPNYASERQKISDAFESSQEEIELFNLPADYYSKKGGYFKSQGDDNFEEFLLSRAERLIVDPFDYRNEEFRNILKSKQKR